MTVSTDYRPGTDSRNTCGCSQSGACSCAHPEAQGRRPLVSYANRCATAGQRAIVGDTAASVAAHTRATIARNERIRAREVLWQVSSLKRVRQCGRHGIRTRGTVDVMLASGTTYDAQGNAAGEVRRGSFSGVSTCSSVWACPVCSARIQAGRRQELAALMDYATEQGYTIVFVTNTLRHSAGQRLDDLWGALSSCHAELGRSGTVRRIRKKLGFAGYVRAVEVTHGKNGWHPHIHSVYLLKEAPTKLQLKELKDAEFSVWSSATQRAYSTRTRREKNTGVVLRFRKRVKLGLPLAERYDMRIADGSTSMADYLAKAEYDSGLNRESLVSVQHEMQGSATKKAKHGSLTPFQILQHFTETGEADYLDLWREYEEASRGRRALTWSQGLKEAAGIAEVADADIPEGLEMLEEPQVVFTIANWSRDIGRREPGLQQTLLDILEDTSVDVPAAIRHATAWCAQNRIELLDPDSLPARLDRMEQEYFRRKRELRLMRQRGELVADDMSALDDFEGESRQLLLALDWHKRYADGIDSMPEFNDYSEVQQRWSWDPSVHGWDLYGYSEAAYETALAISEEVLELPVGSNRDAELRSRLIGAPGHMSSITWRVYRQLVHARLMSAEERQWDADLRRVSALAGLESGHGER